MTDVFPSDVITNKTFSNVFFCFKLGKKNKTTTTKNHQSIKLQIGPVASNVTQIQVL